MKLTFLEAAGGVRLSKIVTPEGTRSYPNIKNVTSHEEEIERGDLSQFERALHYHSERGHCLLKGPLRAPIQNESRKGCTDNIAYADYIVIDADNVVLPAYKIRKGMQQSDVQLAAEQIVAMLPEPFRDVSYIAQASSSLGLKGDRVSLHIYFMLATPLPPKTIKLWLRYLNISNSVLDGQLELSASGAALRYPIDPSVADNSKLIFIAPPTFTDKSLDPFADPEERIVRVNRAYTLVELAPLFGAINPEIVNAELIKKKDKLREAKGLPKKKSNITIVAHGDSQVELLKNPDRVSITVVDETNYPYVRCNINGGDSNAYWFNVDDPVLMLNFKDEPAFEIEKADPEFFSSLFERYSDRGAKQKRPYRPVVMRDFYTDSYWNGVYDPNTNQFTDEFPLTITSRSSIESFMKSHGRPEPTFIPDAKVVFDPSRADEPIQLETPPYYVNMYQRTEYMLKAMPPSTPYTMGGSNQLQHVCPTIYKIMFHMLGSSVPEFEYFMNWLAYIYQNKNKALTAWVLTGVPGTGKGLFANRVLKPLFGYNQVPMRSLENMEEQFNNYMRTAMFVVVDEFRMGDAKHGTHRMADKLKNQITEPTLTIRGMRSNQIELPSYANFLFLTNRPDAVRLEEGDRRYNVAPRQETKLLDEFPALHNDFNKIESELYLFSGVLSTFEVDNQAAHTCINNGAKLTMRSISMGVSEEFLDAVKRGDVAYFKDVLDIALTNTFEAGTISSAQTTVRNWIKDTKLCGWSLVNIEQLRLVYLAFAQPAPPPATRQFSKTCARAGLVSVRKRPPKHYKGENAKSGLYVEWRISAQDLDDLVEEYLDDSEIEYLRSASNE